jgi:hypothetical protein
VIESARAAGIGPQGPNQHIPPGLRAKLPEALRKRGLGTHQAFDEIAADAAAGAPTTPRSAPRLRTGASSSPSTTTSALPPRCVACHATYGLRAGKD